MEREPNPADNLENLREILRQKGFHIKPVTEENFCQCSRDECFDEASWFIEGESYCPKHERGALMLEIDKDAERIRLEREQIIQERRRKNSGKILD